ncbi:MAG: hypothetical protein LBP59_11050 [Planctomycetaceae bacterium]|jgi:hypothetical protein|nr:hypothetical protein [Planctomycetaceae bacterium]
MITISNEYIPWLLVAVLLLVLVMPKSNGGKTDVFSRFLGLLGIKVKKDFEDIERESGLIREDGFDADLYAFRIRRLNEKLSQNGTIVTNETSVTKNAKK